MVRLTAELISKSPAFINPLKQYELDLRGNKIPIIENLGATEDRYETIDLSDNEISKIEGFPLLQRLTCLIFNNNKIARISKGLGEMIPNVETIVLTSNRVQDLADLEPLSELKNISMLSLLSNPVTKKQHYRLFLIHILPKLRVLDFVKVKAKEREEAAKLFGGEAGQKLQEKLSTTRTFIPGEVDKQGSSTISSEQRAKILEAINRAQSIEEINRLELALQTGKLPKDLFPDASNDVPMAEAKNP
jgi:U2 small nuclear ribonucleoprotein A'